MSQNGTDRPRAYRIPTQKGSEWVAIVDDAALDDPGRVLVVAVFLRFEDLERGEVVVRPPRIGDKCPQLLRSNEVVLVVMFTGQSRHSAVLDGVCVGISGIYRLSDNAEGSVPLHIVGKQYVSRGGTPPSILRHGVGPPRHGPRGAGGPESVSHDIVRAVALRTD